MEVEWLTLTVTECMPSLSHVCIYTTTYIIMLHIYNNIYLNFSNLYSRKKGEIILCIIIL